jgi:hypothetical protein
MYVYVIRAQRVARGWSNGLEGADRRGKNAGNTQKVDTPLLSPLLFPAGRESQLVLGPVCPHNRIPALKPCPSLFKSILLPSLITAPTPVATSRDGVVALEPSLLPDIEPAAPTKPEKSPMLGDETVAADTLLALVGDVSDWFGFGSISSPERNEESARSERADVRDRKASRSAFWSVRRTPFVFLRGQFQGEDQKQGP